MNDRIIIHGIQIQKTSPRRETKERSQSFEKGEFYLSFSQQMIINDETLKNQTGGSPSYKFDYLNALDRIS